MSLDSDVGQYLNAPYAGVGMDHLALWCVARCRAAAAWGIAPSAVSWRIAPAGRRLGRPCTAPAVHGLQASHRAAASCPGSLQPGWLRRYATHYGSLASAAASVVAQQAQQALQPPSATQPAPQQGTTSAQAPGSGSCQDGAHASLHWWQDPAKVGPPSLLAAGLFTPTPCAQLLQARACWLLLPGWTVLGAPWSVASHAHGRCPCQLARKASSAGLAEQVWQSSERAHAGVWHACARGDGRSLAEQGEPCRSSAWQWRDHALACQTTACRPPEVCPIVCTSSDGLGQREEPGDREMQPSQRSGVQASLHACTAAAC